MKEEEKPWNRLINRKKHANRLMARERQTKIDMFLLRTMNRRLVANPDLKMNSETSCIDLMSRHQQPLFSRRVRTAGADSKTSLLPELSFPRSESSLGWLDSDDMEDLMALPFSVIIFATAICLLTGK